MQSLFFLLSSFLLFSSCSKTEDMPPVEIPVISGVNLSVEEGNSIKPVYVNIRLSSSLQEEISVFVRTEDETATAGEDYVALNDVKLTFSAGDIQKSVRVDLLGDDAFESDETFLIVLYNASNADIDATPIRITIENDDQDTDFDIPTTGYTSPTTYQGMQLIWSNEFGENQVLEDDWTFEIGNGNSGWGNNELQYYRRENTSTKDGFLVIEAKEENFAGRNYTSSRMITRDNFNFTFGRVDIRAALPEGQGIWPALWMLGSNFTSVGWPDCGEIDIMELLGHEPNKVHGTIHWSNNNQHAEFTGSTTLSSGNFVDRFHVFSIIWEEDELTWLVNNEPFHSANLTGADKAAFKKDFFLIFNIAVGGNWPGSPDNSTTFPQRMFVDYIRVFQEE